MKIGLAILCLSLFTALTVISSNQLVFAEETIIGTSTGLESTSILELKNNTEKNENIETVRIWLSEDNSFKSFKTEKGWTGKFEVGGKVLAFSSQESVKPGENVKFGIKTSSNNPAINWKAIDQNGNVIQSARTLTIESESEIIQEINQPKIIAIKEESSFRLIPEKPSAGSDFRIIGENFVPNQKLTFYIDNQNIKSVTIDNDGKFISTATVPDDLSTERIDFTMTDTGGSEKTISIRIPNVENREISDAVKISIGNTPQDAKRGETILLIGGGTPNTTLTISTNYIDGTLIKLDTILVGYDGKWSHDFLISPDLKLGVISIDISDGKSKVARSIEVISEKLINISSLETRYEKGDTMTFTGFAIPNKEVSVIIEDPIGVEVFSRSFGVGDSGSVTFDVKVGTSFLEGTYVIYAYQGDSQGINAVGIGEEPKEILLVSTDELNHISGSMVNLNLRGSPNAILSLVIVDAADREKIADTVTLGPDGTKVYSVNTEDLGTGAFTVEIRHGNSVGSTVFTIGLSTGSGPIEFQSTKDEYSPGEQILFIGNTGKNSLLTISISDSNDNVIKKVETFSDKNGIFKMDNFRVPTEAVTGQWTVTVKSGGNLAIDTFTVIGETETNEIVVFVDHQNVTYSLGETITITGKNAIQGSRVNITILNSDSDIIFEGNTRATATGEFYTLWFIPNELDLGDYSLMVDDGITNNSISFILK